MQGHTDWVDSVAFGDSNNLIASGSSDGSVRIWDIHTGECLKIFSGHSTPVLSVAFTPDNNKIISSSVAGTIRIWDISQERPLKIIFDRPYEGMNITGVKGLSAAEIETLKALGAVENCE